MGFVQSNLLPDERVVGRAVLSWVPFWTQVLALVFALGMLTAGILLCIPRANGFGIVLAMIGGVWALAGVARLITVLIVLLTTEIVVTTQRFIAKAGMIARSSVELQLTKVESFDVSQSLEGRLFSYGSIAIRGSGTRTIAFQYVKNPVEFRSVCMRASQSVQPAAVVPMPEAVPAPRPTLPTTPAPVLSAFDVQIAAADGSAYSIEVRASTVDEAIARAKATGVQVVSARLKSLG